MWVISYLRFKTLSSNSQGPEHMLFTLGPIIFLSKNSFPIQISTIVRLRVVWNQPSIFKKILQQQFFDLMLILMHILRVCTVYILYDLKTNF